MSKVVGWKRPDVVGQSCELCQTEITMMAEKDSDCWLLSLVCKCRNTPMRVAWVKSNTSAEMLSMHGFVIG